MSFMSQTNIEREIRIRRGGGVRINCCTSNLSGLCCSCCDICIALLRTTAFAVKGLVAVFTDEIFPLEIMYTVQNGGAPFDTRLGTSVVLNLLS